jgi:hypothetical protein
LKSPYEDDATFTGENADSRGVKGAVSVGKGFGDSGVAIYVERGDSRVGDEAVSDEIGPVIVLREGGGTSTVT